MARGFNSYITVITRGYDMIMATLRSLRINLMWFRDSKCHKCSHWILRRLYKSVCVLKKRIHCTIQDMGIVGQDLLWWEDIFHVETHKIRNISLIEKKLSSYYIRNYFYLIVTIVTIWLWWEDIEYFYYKIVSAIVRNSPSWEEPALFKRLDPDHWSCNMSLQQTDIGPENRPCLSASSFPTL